MWGTKVHQRRFLMLVLVSLACFPIDAWNTFRRPTSAFHNRSVGTLADSNGASGRARRADDEDGNDATITFPKPVAGCADQGGCSDLSEWSLTCEDTWDMTGRRLADGQPAEDHYATRRRGIFPVKVYCPRTCDMCQDVPVATLGVLLNNQEANATSYIYQVSAPV